MDSNGDIEHTLFTSQKCHVYRLPRLQQVSGLKCADWNDHLMTARMKVLSRSSKCVIRLEDTSTNKVFALCPINTDPDAPQAVESVVDSSRYFVLRIEDGKGHHAYIGCGFDERNTAFDFKSCVQDFRKYADRMKDNQDKKRLDDLSHVDFSMKQGEKIKINIGKKTKQAPDDPIVMPQQKSKDILGLQEERDWSDFTSGEQKGQDDWVKF